MKKTLLTSLALAVISMGMMAGNAMATPTLLLTDGTSTVTIADQAPGDMNPLPGFVTYIGPLGIWYSNVSSGYIVPLSGSGALPGLDLNSIDVSSGAGDLWIYFSEIGFGPGVPSFVLDWGGTTNGGIVDAMAFFDQGNILFGTATTIGALGPYSGGPFSGTVGYAGAPTSSPFSLTLMTHIRHDGRGYTSFNEDLHPSPVPEPASMLLLGTGLAGLVGVARRRHANKLGKATKSLS